MKYVSYLYQGKAAYGLLIGENEPSVVPMNWIFARLKKEFPADLLAFIELYNSDLAEDIQLVLQSETVPSLSLKDIKLLAPVPYPRRNIFCVGKNYLEHVGEVGQFTSEAEVPTKPVYFTKACYMAQGHRQDIVIPRHLTSELDYEVELALVIAKEGKDIPRKKAAEYIFGYMIANDLTARDEQRERKQWFKGKSLDNGSIFGPCLVSKDEIKFPPQLNISSKVNGKLRQASNTEKMIFDLAEIIADLSTGLTLLAGDIIMTGTPAGVGAGMNPPRFLQNDDVIEMQIAQIGTLQNRIVLE